MNLSEKLEIFGKMRIIFVGIYVITSFGMSACGISTSYRVTSIIFDEKNRTIAEFEKTDALLMATGWGRSLIKNIEPKLISLRQKNAVIANNREYDNLLDTILITQPKLQIFLHAYEEKNREFSEFDLWKPQVDSWNEEGRKISLFKIEPNDFPNVPVSELSEDAWTRDYGLVSVLVDGKSQQFSSEGRGFYVNSTVAKKLHQALRTSPKSAYEGGQFMVTRQSVCATTRNLPEPNYEVANLSSVEPDIVMLTEKLKCQKILTMPPLPNEGTHHIDLFAKFVSDTQVVLADYRDDDVNIENSGMEVSMKCSAAQITNKSWPDCVPSEAPKEIFFENRNLRIKNEKDMKLFISEYHESVSFQYFHGKTLEHLSKVSELFIKEGFEIVKIESPIPSILITFFLYKDLEGNVVHREALLKFTHRSYANSLISNGHLYLPTYSDFNVKNANAVTAYRNLGFDVHEVNMTSTIRKGGAVHCLVKDLHFNP